VHRKTQKRESPDWKARDRDLLRRFCNGKFSSWFSRLRRIQCLSRLPLKQSRDISNPATTTIRHCRLCLSRSKSMTPLPPASMKRAVHDGGLRRAGVCVVFRAPAGAGSARYSIVDRFIALNCALFELVEEITRWETGNAGTSVDRGDHRFELHEALLIYRDRQSSFYHPPRRDRTQGCAAHARSGAPSLWHSSSL